MARSKSRGPAVVEIAPSITLTAAATTVASGTATTLMWSATHADSCIASDGWSGEQATSGALAPLTQSAVVRVAMHRSRWLGDAVDHGDGRHGGARHPAVREPEFGCRG